MTIANAGNDSQWSRKMSPMDCSTLPREQQLECLIKQVNDLQAAFNALKSVALTTNYQYLIEQRNYLLVNPGRGSGQGGQVITAVNDPKWGDGSALWILQPQPE
jgi:hypothetical protein